MSSTISIFSTKTTAWTLSKDYPFTTFTVAYLIHRPHDLVNARWRSTYNKMMMPEPTPKQRFQIHLSTAVVLMFVAGALIWANLPVHEEWQVGECNSSATLPADKLTFLFSNVKFPVDQYDCIQVNRSHAG